MVLPLIIIGIAAVAIAATVLYFALKNAEKDADTTCPPTPVGATTKDCPLKKAFNAKIILLTFLTDVKVCREQKVVSNKYHWKEGEDVTDGAFSKRPAVYLIKNKSKTKEIKVEVDIFESVKISSQGTLKATIAGIAVSGKCDLSKGTHEVTVVFNDLPSTIQWIKEDVSWSIDVPDLNEERNIGTTRVELFFVLDIPFKAIYQNDKGVWVEALRYLCDKANIIGEDKPEIVIGNIAQHCHKNGLMYECYSGSSKYHPPAKIGQDFELDNYLKQTKPLANCYDQASALQALCGAVGIELEWLFLQPFGYINETQLLGWGLCNNPFFQGDRKFMIVNIDDPTRTDFGNHAFCSLNGKILDACAGPHTGNEDKEQYVKSSIDTKTKLFNKSNTGTKDMITEFPGLTKVL